MISININKHRRKESTDMKMTETKTVKYRTASVPSFRIGTAADHGLAIDVFKYEILA